MTAFVVDTNVAVAANGRDTHADEQCQLACVEKLESVVATEVVAIDDGGAILDEYMRRLNLSGMPGVGDAYLRHVFNYQGQNHRVRRVAVTPNEDDRRGYHELPENAFDRSDRKFLAVAVVSGAVVLNATDSDWGEEEALMERLGVEVGESVVVTEKLDGGNTLLHAGQVYGRSVAAPSGGKWMAMVKKYHAWKVQEPEAYLYGEDIYGVHSIAYDPVREHETFHAFALRDGDGAFSSFKELEAYARRLEIPVVPVLFKGVFGSVAEARAFVEQAHEAPSAPGGGRGGVVLRLARRFPAAEFQDNVCKSVRAGHVRTDEHWTRNWRPCRITR